MHFFVIRRPIKPNRLYYYYKIFAIIIIIIVPKTVNYSAGQPKSKQPKAYVHVNVMYLLQILNVSYRYINKLLILFSDNYGTQTHKRPTAAFN